MRISNRCELCSISPARASNTRQFIPEPIRACTAFFREIFVYVFDIKDYYRTPSRSEVIFEYYYIISVVYFNLVYLIK